MRKQRELRRAPKIFQLPQRRPVYRSSRHPPVRRRPLRLLWRPLPRPPLPRLQQPLTALSSRPMSSVPATSPHDDETTEETPALQTAKPFVGGPRQISVQLKASEPSPWWAVIPVAKRAAETIPAPPSEPETATVNGRTSEPAYVDFEESSVGPVIGQVPGNGETEIAPEPPAFPSPTYAPAVESVIKSSIEPAIEQAEPEPMAAVAEETSPREPVREWEVSEPVETQASALEMQVCEPTTAETAAPSEIEEQISTQEWSPEPEPLAEGEQETYQIV